MHVAFLLALAACDRRAPPDSGDTHDPGDAADTGETGDTDTGDTGETGDTGDTGVLGIDEVSRDTETLAPEGLQIVTYAVTSAYPDAYTTNEGAEPRFHVIGPPDAFGSADLHPVLVWLHGGVAGIEGDKDNQGKFCTADGVADLVENAVVNHDFIFSDVGARGWVVVVPESTWCDLWAGLGPLDPVDTNHRSVQHIETALGALEAGLGGVTVDPTRYYAWGTSIGGVGVFPTAYGSTGEATFAGVVSDSGPVYLSQWYDAPTMTEILAHLFGGPPYDEADAPTEFFDNYSRVDAPLLIGERGFRVPVFHAHNRYDTLTNLWHGEALVAALEEHYTPEGVRWFSHELNHHAPGTTYHTQTQITAPPIAYTARAAIRFLEGAQATVVEAEALCETCTVITEDEDNRVSRFSQAAGLIRTADDGAGVLFSGELPAEVPRGVPIELLFVIDVDGLDGADPTTRFITLTAGQGTTVLASQDVLAGDLVTTDDPTGPQSAAHIDATTLTIAEGLPGEGPVQVSIAFHGRGTAYVDAVWAVW